MTSTFASRLPAWSSNALGGYDVDRELAEALRVIAAATRSGSTLEQALAQAAARADGRIADCCRQAAAELTLGVPVDTALSTFARRSRSEQAWLLARVVSAQHRRGGDLGRLCHRLARLLHERRRLGDEARSATAQARFTARAVVALPAVLVLGWAWISPASLLAMVSPGALIIASPAMLGLAIGIIVVRRLALSAAVHDTDQAEPRPGRVLPRLAGSGSVGRQQARLGGFIGGPALALSVSHASLFTVTCMVLSVACALWWPVARVRRERELVAQAAQRGLPDLLESSIALLSAGCTPREVLTSAIEACPGRLGAMLRPAAQQIELGRSPFAALSRLDVMTESPELEAWAFALTDGTRHGAPVTDTLESLLRDVRSADRERFRARAATIGPRIQLAVVLLIVPSIMWLMLVGAAQGLVRQLANAGIL